MTALHCIAYQRFIPSRGDTFRSLSIAINKSLLKMVIASHSRAKFWEGFTSPEIKGEIQTFCLADEQVRRSFESH